MADWLAKVVAKGGGSSPIVLTLVVMIAVGVISIGAQILMTHAYRWVEAMVAGVEWLVERVREFAILFPLVLLTESLVAVDHLRVGGQDFRQPPVQIVGLHAVRNSPSRRRDHQLRGTAHEPAGGSRRPG